MPDYFERDKGLQGHLPSTGLVFIDIGANEGSWSLPFSKRYTYVHSFEPDQRARKRLLTNVAVQNATNITVHPSAMADYDGSLTLRQYNTTVHSTPLFGEVVAPAGHDGGVQVYIGDVTVPCFKLDTVIHALVNVGTPMSIKIDVEGGELAVLRGAVGVLKAYRPSLFIEVHSTVLKEQAIAFLTENNYSYQVVRHPNYKPDHQYYDHHMWLYAYPAGA
jgi:FkbM family methyltransferase